MKLGAFSISLPVKDIVAQAIRYLAITWHSSTLTAPFWPNCPQFTFSGHSLEHTHRLSVGPALA